MFYAYHIGNEIGKAETEGRDSRAALSWRCRELKLREGQAVAALLQHARHWLAGETQLPRTGAVRATREGRLVPR